MKHTEKFLKQRKFYMMLPALVLPFITLIFWALGGGKSGPALQAMPLTEGLNAKLPDAQFEAEREDELWDKLSLYESAARDSAAHETARENDPYFDLSVFESSQQKDKDDPGKLIGTFKRKDRLIDPNEAKVNSKLEELYQEINRASAPAADVNQQVVDKAQRSQHTDTQFTEDVSRLESMMEQIQEEGNSSLRSGEDPEMDEISSMLEKLMDVQHPERVRERLNAKNPVTKKETFKVSPLTGNERNERMVSLTESQGTVSDSTFQVEVVNNDFYDLDNTVSNTETQTNTIPAIIHETQELVNGATVRLRLLQDVTINNRVVPKDQFVHGTCAINGERLMVEITSILNDQTLMPVSLSVYDLSGLEGIYVRGAMSRDAAKQASDDALQNVQLMSMDQSIGLQAASAGIEATKGLLSRKVKLIKVTVKAGHQVVLRNKNEQ